MVFEEAVMIQVVVLENDLNHTFYFQLFSIQVILFSMTPGERTIALITLNKPK